MKVCIITWPQMCKAGYTPLKNLISIINSLGNKTYIIDFYLRELTSPKAVSTMTRLVNYIMVQIQVLAHLIMLLNKIDVFLFFRGGEMLIIPMFFLRLFKKNIALMPVGSVIKTYYTRKDIFLIFIKIIVKISFKIASIIILYSPKLVKELNIQKHYRKIIMAREHIVNFTIFRIIKKVSDREDIIGYVGRLEKEKGILNLIKAIPYVIKKRDVFFIICGSGSLINEIRKFILSENIEKYVKLTGWISHKDLPYFLNNMKLIVLPSYTEGLPNVILEAMACGTPILTTPVGAISDVVKDKETGFLLKSNNPRQIAKEILELLDKPELLEEISRNAYEYVLKNFNKNNVLNHWKNVFKRLNLAQ